MSDWREIPLKRPRRREIGTLLVVAYCVLLTGICVGVIARPYIEELFGFGAWAPAGTIEASTKLAAVDAQGNGVLADVRVELAQGEGVYYSIQPMIELDLQSSANTAVQVASEVTGKNLDRTKVSFTIEVPVQTEIVGGPSAGAAMTVITIAAIENRGVKSDVVITGTINADHTVGLVGGILAKAEAANDAGMKLFLLPKGQYVEVYVKVGLLWVLRYKSVAWLQQHAQEQGWGLEIREVATIEEATELMLS